MSNQKQGKMINLAQNLWPIARSITGDGFKESLDILEAHSGVEFNKIKFKSGESVFDWEIPQEWNINEAYIEDPKGSQFCKVSENNLHIVGYSTPIDAVMDLDELQAHLHSLPDQPAAIPYVTSYYEKNWGFCITDEERRLLKPGKYRVKIDSSLEDGELVIGEVLIQGKLREEVLISTYLCHPSMANNELSGPVVTVELIRHLMSMDNPRYTYRVLFLPETIGSIAYLSRNLDSMKKNIIAGFNVTCVGDNRAYSYLPSRKGNTLSDKVAKHVLQQIDPEFKTYTWLNRGSDERQYCAPGIDLPIASIMRTKYGEYPEYHTSLDQIGTVVTEEGLLGGFLALRNAIDLIENNKKFICTTLGEPHLGKHGIYPQISKLGNYTPELKNLTHVISMSDGQADCIDIANAIGISALTVSQISEFLQKLGILKEIDEIEK